MEHNNKPLISIIIPVYNEEKYIEKCLESIANQTYEYYEIIIVDDGSKDNSKFKIQNSKLQFNIKNLRLIEQKHQGPALTRNLGAKKAKGDILIFLDADMKYHKDFIKEIIQPISKGKEISTFTRNEFVANIDNRWARFWDDVTFSNTGKRVAKNLGEKGTTFRAIKSSVFWKAGGYDSYGSTDDRSVLTKLGELSRSVPGAICYHYNPSSLPEVFYSARWLGRDKGNKYLWLRFIIFFPPWSIIKALSGALRSRNGYFIPFRVVFDLGYFFGLIDIHVRNIHYK